jgi:protein involved in polysaccharide export with SLBB domain
LYPRRNLVRLGALLLAICITVLAGCGGTKAPPPTVPDPLPDIVLPERAPYRLTIGDALEVRFFYYPEYNLSLVVRPDGKISGPLAGEIYAEGMTPKELEKAIRGTYAEVLTEPEVSVIVREFSDQRVFVFGEVKSPGAITLKGNMTIIDAMAIAGGIKETGKSGSVILIRRSPDASYTGYRVDIGDILKSESGQSLMLMPADVVYVPRTAIARVDIFVDQFFNRLTPAWYFYIAGRSAMDPEGEVIFR